MKCAVKLSRHSSLQLKHLSKCLKFLICRQSMANQTFDEIWDNTFHPFPRNSTYAIPGIYDLDIKDVTWVMITPLIIFTMQTGFALVESGVVRSKNEVNIMMKNVVDVCFGGLSYWMFGFALMFGRGEFSNPFVALGDFFVNAKVGDPLMGQVFALYFYQMSFATTSTTIVSGACAERFRFHAYCMFSFINSVVYSISGGWVWGEHGFLRNLGVVDFAGAGPIHIVGGAAALTACWFIGPRIGRYDKGPKSLPMGNPMSACMGLFILWWGWIGFNAGSSYGITASKWEYAVRAGVGTTLATMSAGAFSIIYSMVKNKGKCDVFEVISGVLASLVTINAGCFLFPSYISVLVGALAAFFALTALPFFDRIGIDDPIGATSVHLIGGIWGQLSVGLFAQNPLPLTNTGGRSGLFMGGGTYMLSVQCFSIVCLFFWGLLSTYPIIWFVNKIIPIRLDPVDEIKGCDLVEHYMGDESDIPLTAFQNTQLAALKIGGPVSSYTIPSLANVTYKEFDTMAVRRPYHANLGYDRDDSSTQQQTTERL